MSLFSKVQPACRSPYGQCSPFVIAFLSAPGKCSAVTDKPLDLVKWWVLCYWLKCQSQNKKAAGVTTSDLRPIWLLTLDTLGNFFLRPTAEMLAICQTVGDFVG